MKERKNNTFALFVNDKKTGKQPDYSGYGRVNGVDVKLAVWNEVSEKGTEYLSGRFTIVEETTEAAPKADKKEPEVDNSIDDDIPF